MLGIIWREKKIFKVSVCFLFHTKKKKDTYKTEFAKNTKLDWNSVKPTSTLQNGEAVTGLPVILKEVIKIENYSPEN